MNRQLLRNKTLSIIKGHAVQMVIAGIIIIASLIAGFSYGIKEKKPETVESEITYVKLVKQAFHYQSLVYEKQAYKHNLKLLDTNHFEFNTGNRLVISAANCLSNCNLGNIDGCWKSEITAQNGDTLAIQLRYSNDSPVNVRKVSVNMKCEPSDIGLFVVGRVLVNGKIVKVGVCSIFLENDPNADSTLSLSLCTKFNHWSKNIDIKHEIPINSDPLFSPKSFAVGDVPSSNAGVIITRWVVKNIPNK